MGASRFYPIITILFIMGLFASGLFLPISYSYGEPCLTCQGKGTVVCDACHGSRKCWICDGTGEIWYMPEESNWCAACSGSGVCYRCNGVGSVACGVCRGSGILTHWFYTLAGCAVVLSVSSVLLFLLFFLLSYAGSAFYLSFNEWVYDVKDMDFWFNPSFMTWLFAKHRGRWVKWQTVLNMILAVCFGALLLWPFSMENVAAESLQVGFLLSFVVTVVFSLLFYKSYTSLLE